MHGKFTEIWLLDTYLIGGALTTVWQRLVHVQPNRIFFSMLDLSTLLSYTDTVQKLQNIFILSMAKFRKYH